MPLTNPHTHNDLGSLTIGAVAVLCALENVNWSSSADVSDVRGPCRFGAYNQITKDQATLSAKMFGPSTTGFVNTGVDLSALTVGGVDMKPYTYSLNLSLAFDKQDLPAIGVLGKASGVTGKSYSGSLELVLDDTLSAQNLVVAAESRTLADREVVLSFTSNGVVFALPVQLTGTDGGSTQGEYQKVTVNFAGQAPLVGTAYPTSPVGTTTLLEKALNSPKTNLAFTYSSKLVNGLLRTGFLTWDSLNITITDGAVTDYSYSWMTFGEWATVIDP